MRLVAVSLAVLCASAGCFHRHDPPELMDEVIEERIVHGVVVVGEQNGPRRLVLQTGRGTLPLLGTRGDSLSLERVDGDEISARGVEDHGALRLERFTVVAVGGRAVIDGIVRSEAGHFVLVTQRGKVPIDDPPETMKALVGARIWLADTTVHGAERYGVITP